MVPTVDRGFFDVDFWSIETAGDRPSMKSTSGLSIWPRNCRAYADSDSTERRCPSAKMVSKARLDLPDPDSPVNTISESRGRSSEMSLRLCSRAPRMMSCSATGFLGWLFSASYGVRRRGSNTCSPAARCRRKPDTAHRQSRFYEDGEGCTSPGLLFRDAGGGWCWMAA